MSRTIKTNSGSEFITSINSESLIGILCKEVGARHGNDFVGPTMTYEMTEEEANDTAYKLMMLLESGRYFRLYEKIKLIYFKEDTSIHLFEDFIEDLISKLKQSKGYKTI